MSIQEKTELREKKEEAFEKRLAFFIRQYALDEIVNSNITLKELSDKLGVAEIIAKEWLLLEEWTFRVATRFAAGLDLKLIVVHG